MSELPDIVCTTESWLKSHTPDSVILSDNAYSIFRKDRTDSQGGGVCLIVKNESAKVVRVDIANNFQDTDILCIDIVSSYSQIRLIAGYRPPSSDTADDAIQFTKHFIDCLMSLCDVDSSIIIMGDFNFPNIDWSALQFAVDNDRCSTLFSMFAKQFCLEQLVTGPTRLQPTSCSSSLLDLILCNDPFIVSDIRIDMPFSTSDHSCVNFNIMCPAQSTNLPAYELRNYRDADWSSISSYLIACDWSVLFNDCCSAAECAVAFYAKLNEAISNYVPLKVIKQSTTNKHCKYPPHIRKLNRAKAAAWKRFKHFKSDQLRREYKAISSRCRKAIFAHIANHEQNIINSGNLGKFFRYSNAKFSHKPSIGPLQDVNGIKTIDPQVKAELLANYFQSQFTLDNHILPRMQPRCGTANISSIVFTPVLISRIIKKLNARSAGGPDGIPPVFF